MLADRDGFDGCTADTKRPELYVNVVTSPTATRRIVSVTFTYIIGNAATWDMKINGREELLDNKN